MEWIAPLLAWVEQHPTWAGLFVCLVAFAESLALVGLLLPGAAMMFGIGALVGTGTLALWPTLAWAALGAIAGDGVSFWIGRYFQGGLPSVWPFRTHPRLLDNATTFFERHGGKSVLLGRFVGPIRPVIPAVAGMMQMSPGRFLAINVLSGLLWAPAYILPGMLFAATLGLAAEIATRLALVLGLLFVLLLAIFWSIKATFGLLHPHTHTMITAVLRWSDRHPVGGRLPAALLDPAHPEAKALTLLALVLVAAMALFAFTLETLGGEGLMPNLDRYLFHTFQTLRTPLMDGLMAAVTLLGSGGVLLPLSAVVLAWLALGRHREAAWHLTAVIGFLLAAGPLLHGLVGPSGGGAAGIGRFPCAHAMNSMGVYGFLALLFAGELPQRTRWIAYALAGVLVTGIAFSRLYLGAQFLSHVLAGLSLALAWVTLVGIGYRRHPAGRLRPGTMAVVVLPALAVIAVTNLMLQFPAELERRTPQQAVEEMPLNLWWQTAWRSRPAYRAELSAMRRHPLTIQYAGPLHTIRAALQQHGWQPPPPLTALSWLRWLHGGAALDTVPLLPQVHRDEHDALVLTKRLASGEVLVLRLWPASTSLQPGIPLWVGNTALLEQTELPGFTLPETGAGFEAALDVVREDLAGTVQRTVWRDITGSVGWKGIVLLIRSDGVSDPE